MKRKWIKRLLVTLLGLLVGLALFTFVVNPRLIEYRRERTYRMELHDLWLPDQVYKNMAQHPRFLEENELRMLIIVEFTTSCTECGPYARDTVNAVMTLNRYHPGMVQLILVDVGADTDYDVKKWVKKWSIPRDVMVFTGIDPGYGRNGTPETLFIVRVKGDQWRAIGNMMGRQRPEQINRIGTQLLLTIEEYERKLG